MNQSALIWPMKRMGEALALLVNRRFATPIGSESRFPDFAAGGDEQAVDNWMQVAATVLDAEAEEFEPVYGELAGFLSRTEAGIFLLPETAPAGSSLEAGPTTILLEEASREPQFLLVLGGGRRGQVRVLVPGVAGATGPRVWSVPFSGFRDLFCGNLEEPLRADVNQVLEEAAVPPRRREAARARMLRERLAQKRAGRAWLLNLPPSAPFLDQLLQADIHWYLAGFVAAHLSQYALWIFSWITVGKWALDGRFDFGWFAGWLLLVVSLIPIRAAAEWLQSRIFYGSAAILKRRLLFGGLRLEPEALKRQGAGQLLGRVIESEAVEALAIHGGLAALAASIELVAAAVVLSLGAGGWTHVALLAGWLGVAAVLVRGYFLSRRRWTLGTLGASRIEMTHDLIEKMVGHQTRLLQERPEQRHTEEDSALTRYQEVSRQMDGRSVRLLTLVPRGWILLGLLGLIPAWLPGEASTGSVVVSLGGILLAFGALGTGVTGSWDIIDACIAWGQVAPFFAAARRKEKRGTAAFALASFAAVPDGAPTRSAEETPLLETHELEFHYPTRKEPVLRHCNLVIRTGDRIVLEGRSGGGKSTLAHLLAGLTPPESGLILLAGVDPHTLGSDGWRRRVVLVPQFHENHVVTETFMFNLLMGRRWPPNQQDAMEAEALCGELGLAPLIKRMPSGMLQMVGDSGWQLSNGERSRLYLARALLQKPSLLILDETFASLDPETHHMALECALRRAPTVMVIAHR